MAMSTLPLPLPLLLSHPSATLDAFPELVPTSFGQALSSLAEG